jgi:hypothetical protein
MTVVRRAIGLAVVLALLSAAPGRAQESKDKADNPKPLATAKHDKGLIVEVMEVKPDSNKPLLTIRWRYRNPTEKPIEVLKRSGPFVQSPPRPVDNFIRNTYVLKTGEKDEKTYRHPIARDTGRKLWATSLIGLDPVVVKPGQAVEFWAKFPLPEATTTKTISFYLPETTPIEDLAIQKSTEK